MKIIHVLKGIRGLSGLQLQKIDVSRVISLSSKKRDLKILDTDHDYTLAVEYGEPMLKMELSNMGSISVPTFYTETKNVITRRYKTKNDIDDEINEIRKKQRELKNK